MVDRTQRLGKNGGVDAVGMEAPDNVRLAATRLLMRILSEPHEPEALPSKADLVARLVLDGYSERQLCAALKLSLDDVRAMLVRLAR